MTTTAPTARVAETVDDGVLATLRGASAPVRALLAGVLLNRLGRFLQVYLVLFLTARGFSAPEAGLALGAYGIGTVTPDGTVDAAYGQLLADASTGELIVQAGRCTTSPYRLPDGRLRMREEWHRTDGSSGVSHLEEVLP